jgi:hypothetical protein
MHTDTTTAPDEQPVRKPFEARMWVSARIVGKTDIDATDIESATDAARELTWHDFVFSIDDDFQVDGDETIHVEDYDDEGSDPVEVDMREDGEPFSWEAIRITKALAELYAEPTVDNIEVLKKLISDAHRACVKITGGMEG